MSYARQMLDTYPSQVRGDAARVDAVNVDADVLAAAINGTPRQ